MSTRSALWSSGTAIPALRLAYGIAGDEAEDAVQDAFVKAFRKLDTFRPGSAFRPWLFTIVANEARNRRRSMSRRSSMELRVREQPQPVGTASDALAIEHEERRRLVAAVNELADDHREVVALRFFAGLSESETAEVLSCPLGTAKSRLSRARPPASPARRGGDAMIDLERALTDLADHLDYPTGEHAAEALRRRLTAPDPGRPVRPAPVAPAPASRRGRGARARGNVGVVAIAPARHAVADWLGIGAVEIRRSDRPLPTPAPKHPVPGATGAARDANAAARLVAARKVVQFPIATPTIASAGALSRVDVDHRVPGGLVALTYARFTVVEIATDPIATMPPVYKLRRRRGRSRHVTVNGQPGVWIPSIHEIGYSDRTGGFRTDTVRRSGPVLLWQRAGVTYRIEGLRTLAAAQRVASTMR